MDPEFEEKTFEVAADGELRLTSPDLYSPGQVAEGILGFDVASFQPATSPAWNYIQSAAPGGIRLLPNLWPNGHRPKLNVKLPSYIVSLILQYKRAAYLKHANSKQFFRWGKSYYRFSLERHQQETLAHLERSIHPHAVIRYASPSFHRYSDLERYTHKTAVLANSNYVSPLRLKHHEVWTYVSPGSTGWANPQPEEIPADSWLGLQRRLADQRQHTTVLKHLRSMAQSMLATGLDGDISLPQSGIVDAPFLVDEELQRGFRDLLIIGRVLGRVAANWWIKVEPVKNRA